MDIQRSNWIGNQAQRSLERLSPRVQAAFAAEDNWATFRSRLEAHFPRLFRLLYELYGQVFGFVRQGQDLRAHGFTGAANDLAADQSVALDGDLTLGPLQCLWLEA